MDPVLNPLLNRELQRTGGRTLIRLGSEDIDYSPDFVLLLVTRNPAARFTPDLCSRVTLVNFTVTPASLQSQVCDGFDSSLCGHSPRGRARQQVDAPGGSCLCPLESATNNVVAL